MHCLRTVVQLRCPRAASGPYLQLCLVGGKGIKDGWPSATRERGGLLIKPWDAGWTGDETAGTGRGSTFCFGSTGPDLLLFTFCLGP